MPGNKVADQKIFFEVIFDAAAHNAYYHIFFNLPTSFTRIRNSSEKNARAAPIKNRKFISWSDTR